MKKIVIVLFIFGFVSCDLLTTRNPEEPNTTGNSIIPATTPDILFSNFKSSIEEKVLENYLTCFVDVSFLGKSFKYIASAGSVSQYPVLNSWNIESERQYFKNLKAIAKQGKSVTVTLLNGSSTQFGDSAVYQYDYSLSFLTNDQTLSGDYKGSVQFKIYLDSRNQWVIVEWYDLRKDNSPSWSELKGRLY